MTCYTVCTDYGLGKIHNGVCSVSNHSLEVSVYCMYETVYSVVRSFTLTNEYTDNTCLKFMPVGLHYKHTSINNMSN